MVTIEKGKIISITDITTKVICDCCGKTLDDIDDPNTSGYKDPKRMWYHVTRHHNDWGSDSGDSWERLDYCQGCIEKAFDEYLEDGSFTKEFEVECKFPFIKPRVDENMKGDK